MEEGEDGEEDEPDETGGEDGAEGVGGPEDGGGGEEGEKGEEEELAVGETWEIEAPEGLFASGGATTRARAAAGAIEEDEGEQEGGVEEDQPDEGEGEFEVHGVVAAEGDEGVIGAEKDGGEKINEGEDEAAETREGGRVRFWLGLMGG